MSSQEETFGTQYIQAAGTQEGERYSLQVEELAWLLRCTHQWNSLRLQLLTSLQRALSLPRGEELQASSQAGPLEELKDVLTNVIIMQTRTNEREETLANQLEAVARQGLVERVAVEEQNVRQWVESILEAYQHLRRRALESGT